MTIPTPYPNIDDTKISDVTTWSSNKIKRAMPEGLPEVTSSDNGKFLGVTKDGSKYNWDKVDNPIPKTKSIIGIPGGSFMNLPDGWTRDDLKNLKATDNMVFRYGFNGGSQCAFSGIFNENNDFLKPYAVFIGVNFKRNDTVSQSLYIVLIKCDNTATQADDKLFVIPLT